MKGTRVVDEIHDRTGLQGDRLQEAQFPGEVGYPVTAAGEGAHLFADGVIGRTGDKENLITLLRCFDKGSPGVDGQLLGEPDGGGGNTDVGFRLISRDYSLVGLRRIQAGFGRDGIRQMFDQALVPVGFVQMTFRGESTVRDASVEVKMQGIPIESDPFLSPGERRQQTGREESLCIDDRVITSASDDAQQSKEVPEFPLLFVPYQYFSQVWVSREQGFVAFSDEEIYGCIGVMLVQFFDQRGGQDDVADEGRLYDEEGCRHGTKVRCLWRTDLRVGGTLR